MQNEFKSRFWSSQLNGAVQLVRVLVAMFCICLSISPHRIYTAAVAGSYKMKCCQSYDIKRTHSSGISEKRLGEFVNKYVCEIQTMIYI